MLIMIEINGLKLDKVDRMLLAELDKNCRIPSTLLAKKVKKSRQAVDYRINNLVEKGVILGFKTAINPHKLGLKIYKLYFKLKNIPQEKQRLFDYLRKSKTIYWMGECSGTWDLIFAVFSKGDTQFFELKNEIISKFNKIIVEEAGGILVDVKQYPKMYFTGEISSPTMFAGELIENKLDKIDYLILEKVVNNARISIVDLAGKVKSTPIIVKNRLKKLEQQGVIIQYRISVDINKLGLEYYKAIIKMDRYNKEDEDRFLRYISKIPNIQYLIRNIWQIEPEFVVKNYQEYYNIIENMKKEFPNVIRTVDSVLMITDEWTPGFKNLLKED